MRMYDPRAGRFLSVDPVGGKFPFYSSYQYAGNSPIRFIDLDGAETYDNSAKYWGGQPLINIAGAPAKGLNAAGVPRNALWFFKQQLSAKPEMFSEANKIRITIEKRNPIVDETWIQYNPSHAAYEGGKLVHHHIEGGELVAAIPERLHYDNFSELHPYINGGISPRGAKVSGLLGGSVNVVANAAMFSGLLTGDPDAWVNAFGYGQPHVGEIKKDWGNDFYLQVMSIHDHYVPVFGTSGQPVIDEKTGQPKYRLETKTVQVNVYSGYVWDDDTKSYQGVNKVGSRTEEWQYNEQGKRTQVKSSSSDVQPAIP